MIRYTLFAACFLLMARAPLMAGLRLPTLVGDNMVLQQGRVLPIWGWASPQEKVTVDFLSKEYTAQAGADGKWMVQLAPAKAGGPHTMTIRGSSDKIEIKNILIGEVWLCSGQSNMALDFNYGPVKTRYAAEIAGSRNDQIRQLLINRSYSSFPAADAKSSGWKSAAPETLPQFSAAAYFFARSLYAQYKVPIGLINSSYGGTLAEAWTSGEGLRNLAQFQSGLALLKDTTALNNRIILSKQNMASWDSLIAATDKGLSPAGEPLWGGVPADTADWKRMPRSGYWDRNGLLNTWGVVWFKKEITLTAQQAGAETSLVLGRLDDADITWVNGKRVGTSVNRDVRRNYKIPAGLLHAGSNEVLVRIVNYNGTGGFNPDDSVVLSTGSEQVSLKAGWLFKPGTITATQKEGQYDPKNLPSSLYNAMIAPLWPVAIKGVIWYQGEFNAVRAFEYRQLFPALINDWRARSGDSTLPFIFQQLPNFQKPVAQPSEHAWAELREAQLMALRLPHTGMSVGIDIGEDGDLHPSNKKPVGERLALLARRIAYGERIVASGPLYCSMKIQGDTIVLQFETFGSRLVAGNGQPLQAFAIAGADKKFQWATAFIKDNKVFVFNSALHQPVAVRYAWASNPEGCNLYNSEGLPASPFRTDDWPGVTHAQPAPVTARIARFHGDRAAAISYTFDDGIRDQYELAYPMLQEAGIKATFFVITSVIPDRQEEVAAKKPGSAGGISWEKLREMAAAGHEIASHSWSHPNLPKLNDQQLYDEIRKADSSIAARLGKAPLTFAYPYNAFDDRVHAAVRQRHIASRDYQQAFGNPRFTLAFANSWADKQVREHTWGVAMIHAVQTGFDAFTSPGILREHFAYVKQLTGDCWIDTFGSIALYTQERDSTTLTIEPAGTQQLRGRLATGLDTTVYHYPLTVVVELPGVRKATAAQAGKGLAVTLQPGKILFDALPGQGDISIRWQ